MSAEEAYLEKQRFIAEAERRLRRRLTGLEKDLLTRIFSAIINRLDVTGERLVNSTSNQNLLNTLGTVHREFTKPATIKIVADFARTAMGLPVRGGTYFGTLTGEGAERIAKLRSMSEELLRAKLGLTPSLDLKAGGYLQTVIEDVTVRNKLRALVSRAIEEGGHLTSLRTTIRDYLIGTEDSQGALTRQAEGQLFDTLMDVDRASDLTMANDLELQGAVYVGGLIETTRRLCCELDTKAWTRAEMEALNEQARNGKPWSGYKGDIEIYCGGWNCRHGWRWVTNSALLRMRADLEVVPGTKKVRYRSSIPQQQFNGGCGKGKVKAEEAIELPSTISTRQAETKLLDHRKARMSEAFKQVNPTAKRLLDRFRNADGSITEQRAQLHAQEVADAIDHIARSAKPILQMLGGGPASGKSNIIERGVVQELANSVHADPDHFKQGLPEYVEMTQAGNTDAAAFAQSESSLINKMVLKGARDGKKNVLWDGTGDDGLAELTAKLQPFRDAGYEINAEYVTVPTDMAWKRAEARGIKTGRFVPEEVVRGTRKAISQVLPEAVKSGIFDHMNLWDTSQGGVPVKVAEAHGTTLIIHHKDLWNQFLAKAYE